MKKNCTECNEPISGRSDKRFCSDACRNAYNNKANSDATNYVRNINNQLRKNRRILESRLVGEKTMISRDLLVKEGFVFDYFTTIYKTKKGVDYYFCYEYGYLPLESDQVLIVKK